MSRAKEQKGRQGKGRKSSAPVAGTNPSDPKRSAQAPMADPLEMRMKGESHQM